MLLGYGPSGTATRPKEILANHEALAFRCRDCCLLHTGIFGLGGAGASLLGNRQLQTSRLCRVFV